MERGGITVGGEIAEDQLLSVLPNFPINKSIHDFNWSKIPTLADSDKEPSPNEGWSNGSSPFNPNTKVTVNKPQRPVIISSNNNKLTNSSNNKELTTNKGVMLFNGVVIEQLETFKKKYFLTKEAINLVQNKLLESVISLYSKENNIDDNKVNSVKFMEFSEFDNNSLDEFDLMSTIPAENLINNPELMSGKLNEIAKSNGTVNVNARMAVIKENYKVDAALVRTDGVLVTKEVPVYKVNSAANSYHVDIKNMGIEYLLKPTSSPSGLGLQGNVIQRYANENKNYSYPEKVELPNKVENKRIDVPYPHQFFVKYKDRYITLSGIENIKQNKWYKATPPCLAGVFINNPVFQNFFVVYFNANFSISILEKGKKIALGMLKVSINTPSIV